MLIDVTLCRTLESGELRWEIRYPLRGTEGLRCITLRLTTDNKQPLDYLPFHRLPPGNQRYRFSEDQIQRMASIHNNLDEAISFLLRDGNSARR